MSRLAVVCVGLVFDTQGDGGNQLRGFRWRNGDAPGRTRKLQDSVVEKYSRLKKMKKLRLRGIKDRI